MDLPSRPQQDDTTSNRPQDGPTDSSAAGTTPTRGQTAPNRDEIDRVRLARGATLDRAALDRLEEFHKSIVRLRKERQGLIGDFRTLTRPRSAESQPETASVRAAPAAETTRPPVDLAIASGAEQAPAGPVGPPPQASVPEATATLTTRADVDEPGETATPPHGDALAATSTERVAVAAALEPVAVPLETVPRASRVIWVGALAAAAVVILAVVLVWFQRAPHGAPAAGMQPPASAGGPGQIGAGSEQTVPTRSEAATAPAARGTTGEVQARARGIHVEIVTVRPVWIRAVADGRRALESLTPADQTITFDARSAVVLRIGDGGAVRLRVNGVDEGLAGRDGQVVDRRFVAPGEAGAPSSPQP